MGKNAGGTLGAPLEEVWGRPEPFDIDWYPELPEGGIPNDDLEMQLVWLAALTEVGPGLKAADLARYWLTHIGYNWDEYGLSKTNLRRGLVPPISGSFNNWFVDCMGCPIRSEIWACVAPGNPRVAARYAYEDAICDHAGGESVYGELFNVATQSAAFVVSDLELLLDIGLSYIPADSATALAIRVAREAHAEGVDWQAARERILAAVPNRVAQYSPINLGFQVLGMLYGRDFGDALCITVNAGYDTDSSGASIGSLLGIVAGRSGLPERWLEPFGEEIATNESWGGVRHISDGVAAIPTTLSELVDQIITQAQIVAAAHQIPVVDGRLSVAEDLFADESVRELWSRSATTIEFDHHEVRVAVDHLDDPVVLPGRPKSLRVTLTNPHPDPVTATVDWLLPTGWQAPDPVTLTLEPQASSAPIDTTIGVGDPVAGSQTAYLAVHLAGHPTPPATPVTLVGAEAWQVTGALEAEPTPSDWTAATGRGNALPVEQITGPGRYWLCTWLQVDEPQEIVLGLTATVPLRGVLDGVEVQQQDLRDDFRPNYGRDIFPTVHLTPGWHEYLAVLEVTEGDTDVQAHLLMATADRLKHGITSIGRTRFPSESEQEAHR